MENRVRGDGKEGRYFFENTALLQVGQVSVL